MMNDIKSDYRLSHLGPGKGRSYHHQFRDQPYRSLVWEHERGVLDRVSAGLMERRGFRHLDFACGTGRVLEYLSDRATVSTGVDLSPSMLEVARETAPAAEIIEADLTREDLLGDRVFDLITAFRFFPNAQAELREEAMEVLARHLAPDGILIFNNHKNTASLRNRLARVSGRRGFQGMSPEAATRLLNNVGLVPVEVEHFGVLPATEYRLLLPRAGLRRIEFFLSRCPVLTYLSQNLIYICQHEES